MVCPRALSAQNPRHAEILPTLNSLEEVFGLMENSTSPCSKTGLGNQSSPFVDFDF
jgi:hypothetical protein